MKSTRVRSQLFALLFAVCSVAVSGYIETADDVPVMRPYRCLRMIPYDLQDVWDMESTIKTPLLYCILPVYVGTSR